MKTTPFEDRRDAGIQLARALRAQRSERPIVLGLARGGVPVAAEIAKQLHATLDVIVARKLGAPDQEELAIGAVTADGTRFINDDIVRSVEASPEYIDRVCQAEQAEAKRREKRFRSGCAPLQLANRTVIIVDDGLATGATMRAAIHSVRRADPKKIIVAVPVGAAEPCAVLRAQVDELVCLQVPTPFYAVGAHYRDFDQTSDDEVIRLLNEHRTQASRAVAT